MSRVDDLRSEFEVAARVAALEDELAELKAAHPRCGECGRRTGDQSDRLAEVKRQLRDWRYVLRLGRQTDPESVATLAALNQLNEEG